MRKHISIKTALILPFGIFIGVLLALLIFVWQNDYDWIAKEQGSKIVRAVNTSTQEKINELLKDPLRVNLVFAAEIRNLGLSDIGDLEKIQSISESFMKTIQAEVPQISVISYGDEKKRFVGMRANDMNDFSLMLKDERTKGMLNIYETENIQSPVVGSYENYDPTTRPWYAPVKIKREVQWSEIYVNADEKMDITISSLVPVFDNAGRFRGVTDIDVKLNGITAFLKADPTKGSGVIYIVDDEWNLIAHSGTETTMKLVKDAAGVPGVEMIKAYDFENLMIKSSAKYLNDNSIEYGKTQQMDTGIDRYFVEIAEVDSIKQLGWRVVTVIPENDLMGSVRSHQNVSLWVILIMGLVVSGIGLLTISMLTKPIKQSSEAALALSHGDFDAKIDKPLVPIAEMDELMLAFNDMAFNLKDSFEKMQVSEEKYRSLVENIDDMIYSLTPEGNFIAINQRFEREIGRPRAEILGQGLDMIFKREEEIAFWKEQLRKVCLSQAKSTYQFAYVRENGKRSVYNVNLIPMINILGQVEMILGSNTDITELVEAQEEIQELHEKEKSTLERMVDERTQELKVAMEELIEKEKMASLGGLVSGIAHEINTPLGVSVSAASYLKTLNDQIVSVMVDGKMTKTNLMEYFHNMDETSKILNTNLYRAAELVKSFKEISINQVTEDMSYFNFNEYLHMILLSLKHEYKNSGSEIEVLCDEDMIINSYPGVYAQIFTNLIMNSLIHGLRDVENGKIKIEVSKEKDLLLIHFSDNGVGIPKKDLHKIFEPFFTTNREKGGSGLGLNVVYNLVTGKLNGKITCQSTDGDGTHFYMRLPLTIE